MDSKQLWFLSVFVRDDGRFEKYSLDKETANDSHYVFTNEQVIRKNIYAPGDENKYFHEILARYVQANGGEALLSQIMPYVTAQFHFYHQGEKCAGAAGVGSAILRSDDDYRKDRG